MTRISPFTMTTKQIAATVVERYGRERGADYLRKLVERAGVANYGRKYAAALALVQLVTYPVTRADGRVVNVTIPED